VRSSIEGNLPELLGVGQHEELRIHFRALQQWICELLIKNQQLRMALFDINSRDRGETDGRSA
jgi:hypothetical protein